MHCDITDPGHATNLTGVKVGLALARDPYRTLVPATIDAVDGASVTLSFAGGVLEARCHDARRLSVLLAAASDAGAAPKALFTAHEHQLFVEVDPELYPRGIGTEYLSDRSSTGVLAAFNVALPWHADVPCGRRAG